MLVGVKLDETRERDFLQIAGNAVPEPDEESDNGVEYFADPDDEDGMYPTQVEAWLNALATMHAAIVTVQDWLLSGEPLESITRERVEALPVVAAWVKANQ